MTLFFRAAFILNSADIVAILVRQTDIAIIQALFSVIITLVALTRGKIKNTSTKGTMPSGHIQ